MAKVSEKAVRRIAGRVLGLCALSVLAACETRSGPAPGLAPSLAPPPVACVDFSFPIYFETGSEVLTSVARQEIGYAAERVRGCKLGPVAVIGLADADGPARRNLALSRRRAAVTAAALAAAGLPAPTFDIEALGEQGALTPDGKAPLRRRTDVVIRASAPPPAT